MYVLTFKVWRGELCWRLKHTGNGVPRLFSASSGGGWVFGFQALFEAAKQNPIALVLLVFPGVELPLDFEAPVHDESGAQHRELVSSHMELTSLEPIRG